MYKPANIREFVTDAIHQKLTRSMIYGREQETWANAERPNLRGAFKQKSSSQMTANGLVVVGEKITYTTWYKSDLADGDRLIINGTAYTIKGAPDNTEGRNRYAVCTLERVAENGTE